MLDFTLSDIELDKLFIELNNYKKIGLAVSGGADSMALMLMVAKWAKKQKNPPELFIYSFNHNLRKNSKSEAEYVVKIAKKLGLNAEIINWEGEKPTSSIQEKARLKRYQSIAKKMENREVEILLTAHHARDQSETILMRLARGSGIKGLGAMRKFTQIGKLKIFRPLLELSPDLLRQISKSANIEPINDPSNENEDFERIRWRKILPALSKLGLDEKQFSILSKRFLRADSAIEEYCNLVAKKIVQIDKFGVLHIGGDDFFALNEEIKIRILQKSIQHIGNDNRPYNLAKFEQLSEEMSDWQNFRARTIKKCKITLKNNFFTIVKELPYLPREEYILRRNEEILWDNRFLLKNISFSDGLIISPAINLTRIQLKNMGNIFMSYPMNNLKTAPLIMNAEKKIIALGAHIFAKENISNLEAKILQIENL